MSTETLKSDPLETLLDLVLGTCEDVLIANGGYEPYVTPWYILGYWRSFNDPSLDGEWEIEAHAPTLREALCAFIADPRFGA